MWLPGLVVATIGLAGGGSQASAVPLTVALTQTVVSTFAADADTRVHEAFPTTNYGSRIVLRVDGASDLDIESYLRFTVSGLAGSVQRATLRLHATEGTSDGPTVSGTSNDWAEMAVTWSDRPTPTTAAVDDEGAIATDSWVEFDVTSLVSTDGTFSFALAATSPNSVDFDSRESTSTNLRPELAVETLTSNAPVNASPPTITGVLQEGATVTAAPGSWNGSQPMSFTYQWQRCDAAGSGCTDIADASGESYALTQGDVGATFRVMVTATNADGSATAASAPTGTVIGAGDVVIAAAGDIASCTSSRDEATAQLLDSIAPTRVLTLGDNVYPDGADVEFAACYDPTWGETQGQDPSECRQPRVPHTRRRGLFQLLRGRGRRPGEGLLRVRPRGLASLRPELELRGGSVRCGLRTGAMAAHRSRCTPAKLHRSVHAPPAVLVQLSWEHRWSIRPLERALRLWD